MNLTLSVLIPTRNRCEDISKCINSIINQSCIPETIIVVDSSDKDGLKEKLEKEIEQARIEFIYIKSEIKSAGIQRNIGIEKNNDDIILILDDDIILEKNFVKEIKDIFEEDIKREIGAVTGKITNERKLGIVSTIIRKIFCLSENGKGEIKKSWSNNNYWKLNEISEVQWLPSGCSAYRKQVFVYENFDNNLFGYSYMEDVDVSYRIGKKIKLIYDPLAKCIHNHKCSPSTRLNSREKQKVYMKNYQYLFKKNMPQQFNYKFCHYWSYIGYLIRGFLLERNLGFVLGTIEGIFINIFGKNELVKKRK